MRPYRLKFLPLSEPTDRFKISGTLSETPFPGDWQLVVTGVPPGVTPATVAALITSSPVALALPFASLHWRVAYASLGSAVTATPW